MIKFTYQQFVILVCVIVFVFLFFYFRGRINDNKFFTEKINSKVTSRNSWQGRAMEFYLDNGLRIDSSALNEIDIQIGDSIVKDANSWYFKVFKKNTIGHYSYYKTYNLDP